ncbi:GNAT family N-acetyltransferase [Acinetobacter wanghuae]|uniref:GNAT family N-acetyltransferase n=1 Tax=Acinetobacter wanghuae TaxID=2662362 RepID=UPI003AF96EF2
MNIVKVVGVCQQQRDAQTMIADHTWVDPLLRGEGLARQLLDALVSFAREKHLKIIPQCSYVDVIFRRDPSLADVDASIL